MKVLLLLTVFFVACVYPVTAQDKRIDYPNGDNLITSEMEKRNAPFLMDNLGPQFNNPQLESLTPSEGFESATFPPTGWTRILMSTNTTTQYWIRTSSTVLGNGAYGMSFSTLNFNCFSAPAGTKQAIQTPNFPPTVSGEVLRFDLHYMAWTGAQVDSLWIQASSDGVNFTDVIAYVGDTNQANYLNPNSLVTVSRLGTSTIQDQGWIQKNIPLPVGTIAIRFVGYSGFGNNILLDNIETLVPPPVGPPLAGVYTINASNPPSGTNFQTFRAFADSISKRGVSGPVTVNVAPGIYGAGNRCMFFPIAGTSSTNRITIQKSGAGEVVLADTGTTSVNDFMVLINGADWMTFDGIDIRDGSLSANGQLNRGFFLNAWRGYDGARNITIKNSHIVLGGVLAPPGASIGIVATGIMGSSSSQAEQSGSCDSLTIQNIRINKSDRGIGTFVPVRTVPSQHVTAWHRKVEISNCILGDSISIGSRTAPNVIGIIPQGTKDLDMHNNRIDSLGNYLTTSTGAVSGFACQFSSGRVYNNVLRNMTSANLTSVTPILTGISAGPNSGEDLYIYNNLLYNFVKGYTGAANATVIMQAINLTNFWTGAAANTINHAYNNTIIMEAPAPVTYTSGGITLFAAGLPVDVRNNCIINKISTSSATAKAYGFTDPNATRTFLNSNYNNIFVNGTNGFTGAYGTGLVSTALTIADWKAGSTGDTNSVSGDVAYITLFPLNIDANNSGNWVLNGKGYAQSIVSTDINGASRNTSVSQGTTDIGANEFNMAVAPPFATESAPPSSGGVSYYMQFGDTVCIVEWGTGGTLPTGLNVSNFTGDFPPNSGNSHHLAKYMNVTQVGGPISGTFYNMIMKFGYNQFYNITNPSTELRLAKQNGTFWTAYLNEGTGGGQTQLNPGARRIAVNELNSFSNFTATDISAPLSTVSLAPVLVSPGANDTIPPNSANSFIWLSSNEIVPMPGKTGSTVSDASISNYWYEINSDTSGASVVLDSTLTDTVITVPGGTFTPFSAYFWRVRAKNENGWGQYSPWRRVWIDLGTGLTNNSEIPVEYNLYNNYPNPFNPSTSIKFDIPKAGFVSLKVYDITGREVATLVNEVLQPSRYNVEWNGSQFSSGVYFYRIQAGDFVKVQKMILTK